MDAFGLPMSFGKKSKAAPVNMAAKVETTKRAEAPAVPKEEVKVEKEAEAGPSRPRSPGPSVPQAQDEDEEDIGPMPPASIAGKRKAGDATKASDGEDDEEEDEDEEEEPDRTPITHEIVLKDHTKTVSALSVDPSGSRIATGGYDYDAKLWDFGGMDARLKPFKSWEPNGNYLVRDLDWSSDGKRVLVVSGTFWPKVFDRDGTEETVLEFQKGDVYLRDMKNTKGHTAEINAGRFHPTDENRFLTCSNDSTLRIWDVNDRSKQKQVIVVKSKERGARTMVSTCAWSHDGKLIAGACTDGTLHIWSTNSNLARPDKSCETAHEKGSRTSGVVFARDGRRLATRGGDDTVKLWDIRSMRKPLAVATGLENRYSETNLIFSPDERSILTGVPPPKAKAEVGSGAGSGTGIGGKGSVVFLNGETLAEERRVVIGDGAVVRILWHSRINQLFATTSKGALHILYSPHSSTHGALLPLSKLPKSGPRDPGYSSADIQPVIFNPDALPQFADQKYGESLHQRDKRAKRMKPMEPVQGVGKGGRLGASAMQGLVHSLYPNEVRFEDPREALLRFADKEKEGEGEGEGGEE
ncbi:putative transcription factor [Dioszegia hungarica]|uniref:Transcription factor n=1 Tax=Dioszegia hungarica TaxID=4972 RepID=A0AA38LSS3_9TREE|nr:putative transcription factor [Dioszegia hungarica]KAI9631741.1 putative transcription factor [Dioszegia hungarica]